MVSVLQICQFVLTVLEIGMCYAFCDLLIEKNKISKVANLVNILVVLVLAIHIFANRLSGGFINHLFYLLQGFVMAIPICKLNKVKYSSVLSITMLYHSGIGILYVIVLFIVKFLMKDDTRFVNEVYLKNSDLRLIVMFVALLFVCFIFAFLKTRSNSRIILAQKMKKILLVYGIFGWWFISWGLTGIMFISWEYAIWYIVTYICIIIIVCASVWGFADSFIKEIEINAVQLKTQMMDKYYNDVKLLIENCLYTTHDMKNHIVVLTNYVENNDFVKMKSYLEKIAAPIKEINQYIWSDNEIVNLIINTKLEETRRRKIRVNTKIDNILFPMTDNELCSILANLLDNAVEACEKVQEADRWIDISIKDSVAGIFIKVENSIAERPEKRQDGLVSKKQGYHGYGLKSTKAIVDKYNGTMKCDFDENTFSVVITIEKGGKNNG